MSEKLHDGAVLFSRVLPAPERPGRKTMTLPDGYVTTVYIHVPPPGTRLREPVVYLHGIQSHPGWFVASAAALAKAGHPVLQATRRGSGDNRNARGHAASAKQLLGDVTCVCEYAMKAAHASRVHLVGASWGGKLAAAYAMKRPAHIPLASVTMIAPGIVPHVDVSLPVKACIVGALLVRPRTLFKIPLNDARLFTDNLAMREFIRGDPHRLHKGTASLLFASRRLDSVLRRAREGVIAIPTTLLLAAKDRIVNNVATRRVVIHLTAGREVTEEFDAAHTLEFESSTRQFLAALLAAVARGER